MKNLLLLALVLLNATSALARSHDFVVNGIGYYLNKDGKSVTVTQKRGSYSGEVIIPKEIKYLNANLVVTSIDDMAFYDCSSLTSVTIPNSVKSIGNSAFCLCTGLTSVSIPNSVKSIGSNAFSNCSGITSVTIPDSVSNIGGGAFYNCSSLTSVIFNAENCEDFSSGIFDNCNLTSLVIGEGVKRIPSYFAYNQKSITDITIPNTVTSIGESAFAGCAGFSSITIPDGVTSIGDGAFCDCVGVTSITIPNSATSIGSSAFSSCSGLSSVTIGNNLTTIGISAFNRCLSLTSVIYNAKNCDDFSQETFKDCNLTSLVIGEDVKRIPSYLAYGQKKLTSIKIPDSVNYIGQCAFGACTGLTSVIIGENVTDICSGAFAGCSSITSVIFNAENCKDFSFPESPFNFGNLTTLIIGEGVKHIPSYFAYNQKSITDITIPNSVTSIGSSAFFGCSGLKAVNISDIAAWCEISFSNEESNPFYISKHLYVNGSEIHDLLIPKSVSSIGDFAFYGCSSLKSIHIQGSVSSVGTQAFYGCNGLTKVNISDVAAWCNISFSSFNDNPISYTQHLFVNDVEIKDLIIPSTVTSIGDNVFPRCSELKSVTIPNSVVSIGKGAFYDCENLVSVSIPHSVVSIGAQAFLFTPWYDSLSSGLVYIGDVLYGYKGVMQPNTSVAIKEGTVSISAWAFDGCQDLVSVSFPNSVKTIGERAFSNCVGLNTVNITNGVVTIGEDAFSGCSGLSSIIIPNTVTSIGWGAFNCCTGLKSVNIPNSVTSIGNSAFSDCSGLASVTIGNGVTTIGDDAFNNCSNLTEVIYNAVNCNGRKVDEHIWFEDCQLKSLLIGEQVKSIPAYLACGQKQLTSITIPNSVASIGDFAFSGCSGLSSVGIPDNVTTIGDRAFQSCSGLASLNIPNSVATIGSGAFARCSGLISVNISESVAAIKTDTFEGCSSLKAVTIPDNVTTIADAAFSGCSDLEAVTIGKCVASIGYQAFGGCVRLNTVTFNAVNCSNPKTYEYVLFNDSQLKSLLIGEHVKSIPAYLAWGQKQLTSITIPNSVNVIGRSAFAGCSGLTSVSIGDSVIIIDDDAFSGCTALTDVEYNAVSCCSKSWFKSSQLNRLVVGEKVECIPAYFAFGQQKLKSITIPESVTSIDETAFLGCNKLSSVNFKAKNCKSPVSGRYAWFCNSPLTNLVIGDQVNSIPAYLAYDQSNLTSIIIPSGVTSIGDNAFNGCSLLDTILCKAHGVPDVEATTFSNYNATLYVPIESFSQYRKAEYWKQFRPILVDSADIKEKVTSLVFDKNDTTLLVGAEVVITPSILSTSATHKVLDWKSSDDRIAVVDENGVVTGKEIGQVIISATTTDGSDLSAKCSVTVKKITLGDVNNDSKNNVQDVLITANVAIGKKIEQFIFEAADINNDGIINVADVVLVANIAVGNSVTVSAAPRFGESHDVLHVADFMLNPGEECAVDVMLDNTVDFSALQMNLRLPAGVNLKKVALTGRATDGHAVVYNENTPGNISLMAFAASTENFTGNDGAILKLTLQADKNFCDEGAIELTDVKLAESDGYTREADDASARISAVTTGVEGVYSGVCAYAEGQSIVIETTDAGKAQIVRPNGVMQEVKVNVGRNTYPMTDGGIYFIRFAGKTFKVII